MNKIKSFVIYNEIFRLIDTIKPVEKRDEFLGKLMDFYFKDEEPKFNLNSYEEIVWENISKPIKSYKSKVINGSKGGRPKKTETKTEIKSKNESESETTSDVFVSNYVNNYVVNGDVNNLNIYEYIETNFGRTLNPIEYEEISKWEDNELTRYAIKTAVLNNAYSIKYIIAILGNWKAKNLKTVAEVQKAEAKHKGEELPEWFDKKVTGDKLNTKEESELREIVKAYE